MVHDNLREFYQLPVKDFKTKGDIADFSGVAPRVRCEYDDKDNLADYLSMLLDEPGSEAIGALVLGMWIEDGEPIQATPREAIELLVARKDELPNLEALFVGDIISEENEMSWIENDDMSPLWSAFPKLHEFGVRGTNGLRLGKINHPTLKKLVVESGGLPAGVTSEALQASAPLEHFELWFGIDDYGLTTSIDQFDDLFAGLLFPNLKTLALRNSDLANELAKRIATSTILMRIEHLDLSFGTLTDEGAEALLQSGNVGHLKSLDIHHHYVSKSMCRKLAEATPKLIADDRLEPEEYDGETYYYVGVSE